MRMPKILPAAFVGGGGILWFELPGSAGYVGYGIIGEA